MAGERLRCRERFKASRQVRECETEFERRHRAYNEVYLEAPGNIGYAVTFTSTFMTGPPPSAVSMPS